MWLLLPQNLYNLHTIKLTPQSSSTTTSSNTSAAYNRVINYMWLFYSNYSFSFMLIDFFLRRGWGSQPSCAVNEITLVILILPSRRHEHSTASKRITILGAWIYLLTPWYPFPSSFTPITHKKSQYYIHSCRKATMPEMYTTSWQSAQEVRVVAFHCSIAFLHWYHLGSGNFILSHLFSQ
jgi:hypothetical protein